MFKNTADETNDALLTLAQQNGYVVSSTQLVRWHRVGLLPRPHQLPLQGARGTYSLYPLGTGEQLLLLCKFRTTERRFSHLAWHLWLAGYPVDLHLIRAHFVQASLRLNQWMRWFTDFKQAVHAQDAQDTTEEMLDFIEHYATGNLHSPWLRRVRKRTGHKHFPTFLCFLVKLAAETGSDKNSHYDDHEWSFDLRILALGLGLQKRFVQRQDAFEYYMGKFLVPQLRWLFQQLQTVQWEYLMERVSDFELLQIRDELRTRLLWSKNASEHRKPKDHPSFDLNLSDVFYALPIAEQALVIVCLLALRSQYPQYRLEMLLI